MERPGADSEEKREPVGDIDIAVVDSLKALDLEQPIREADVIDRPFRAINGCERSQQYGPFVQSHRRRRRAALVAHLV